MIWPNYNYVLNLFTKIKISKTKPDKYGTKNTKNSSLDVEPSILNCG
tara:strand:+ start:3243 stop:3383 length:141 start_codon:yes stop_codon:yes gene_type:complete